MARGLKDSRRTFPVQEPSTVVAFEGSRRDWCTKTVQTCVFCLRARGGGTQASSLVCACRSLDNARVQRPFSARTNNGLGGFKYPDETRPTPLRRSRPNVR